MTQATNTENALKIIAAQICGTNLAYKIDLENNTAKIVATQNGIFIASDNRLQSFNNISDKAILNCMFSYSIVGKNQVIAKLEVNNKISMEDVDNIIFKISGNSELLNIIPKEKTLVSIINIKYKKSIKETENTEKTNQKIISNISFLDASFTPNNICDYDAESLDNAIYAAQKTHCNIIFITSPIDDKSIIKEVINKNFDNIVCSHFPEIGVSDIIIATKKNLKIIALPYNYANNSSFNLDILINKALLTQDLIASDFIASSPTILNTIEKIKDTKSLIIPISDKNSINKGNIAGIILAAGSSLRAKENKLFALYKNEPVLLTAVKTAIKAGISPIFVILGHRQEEAKEILNGLDINIMINDNYRSGIKSSIELGIKSLPSFCKGAFLIPADMPYLTEEHLTKMLNAFDLEKEDQLILSQTNNISYNPVLWSKNLFEYADIVPENSANRALFISHKDYTQNITADNEKTLKDITFPADIKELNK